MKQVYITYRLKNTMQSHIAQWPVDDHVTEDDVRVEFLGNDVGNVVIEKIVFDKQNIHDTI